MRTLIGALLAMTALSPTLASAQEARIGPGAEIGRDGGRGAPRDGWQGGRPDVPRDDQGDRGGPRPPQDRDGRGPGFAGGPGGPRADPGPDRGPDRSPDRQGYRDDGREEGQGYRRGDDRGPPRGPGRPDPRGGGDWTGNRFDGRGDDRTRGRIDDRGQWNRGWRGDDRYDWSGNRSAHRGAYRLPRYYAPGGRDGGYRRFAIGTGLGASLWSRDYWIADPYSYRLPQAYGPYRWVRYYDDALLIDQRNGRVVDAVYGIFW